MRVETMSVLLVGENLGRFPRLLRWLDSRGCFCQFALSHEDACNLVSQIQFDLVISQYQLPDRTAFPLLDLLAGSSTTLIFTTIVENDSLWLPMLERGERCIGGSVLQANNLSEALDKVLSAALKSGNVETLPAGVGFRPS